MSLWLAQAFLIWSRIVIPNAALAGDPSGTDLLGRALEKTRAQTLDTLNREEGFWHSKIDVGPVYEALTLALGQKIGLLEQNTKDKFIEKILRHQIDGGWPVHPGIRSADHDSTGIVLLSLKKIGIPEDDPRVSRTWASFRAKGGIQTMDLSNRTYLYFLGEDAKFPEHFVGSPSMLRPEAWPSKIFNFNNYSVLRSVLPPLTLIKNFRKLPSTEIDGNVLRLLRTIDESRNKDDGWYMNNMTLMNLSALAEARDAGVPNLDAKIVGAWRSLLKLEARNCDGEPILQPHRSTVWDTASFAMGLMEGNESRDEALIHHSMAWLANQQIRPANGPSDGRRADVEGGWSFDHMDITMPDVDDTGVS